MSHPLFRAAHPERAQTLKSDLTHPQTFNNAVSGFTPVRTSIFSDANYVDTALRTGVSIGIEKYTEDCIKRGVKYGFGTKDGRNSIDCSGFVQKSIQSILATTGIADQRITAMFTTHSDGQIQALAKKTGLLIQGKDVNAVNIKAGMIIGIDSGDKKWDRGRSEMGIDHIGIVYADSKTGKLMFAESRGGVGVMSTELDKYLASAAVKGHKLFAADVVKLTSDEFKQGLEATLQERTTNKVAVTSGLKVPVA